LAGVVLSVWLNIPGPLPGFWNLVVAFTSHKPAFPVCAEATTPRLNKQKLSETQTFFFSMISPRTISFRTLKPRGRLARPGSAAISAGSWCWL
jgi:hypothetical protein